MKTMKKVVALAVAVMSMVSLAACGGSSSEGTSIIPKPVTV